MIKNKKILSFSIIVSLAVVFILLSLVKILTNNSLMSASFYIEEFSSYVVVLILVFYVDNQLNNLNEKIDSDQTELEHLKAKYGERESELLMKIMALEEEAKEELRFSANREKTVNKIFKGIDFNKSIEEVSQQFLSSLSKNFELVLGVFYWDISNSKKYDPIATYALEMNSDDPIHSFDAGEGFCGQAVVDKEILVLEDVPNDYIRSSSGLGEHLPVKLYFIPIIKDGSVLGLIELGTFKNIEIGRIWKDINNKLVELLK